MRLFSLILLLGATITSCERATPPAVTGNPSIAPTEQTASYRGSSSGPELMNYAGYRVSEILADLTDGPLQYRADQDPRVDFRYDFAGLDSGVARSEAIRALALYVSGHSDTVDVLTDAYLLTPAVSYGRQPSASPGAIESVDNDRIRADRKSLPELATMLRKYRSETYFTESDTCCATVSFDRGASTAVLEQDLLNNSGVELRPVKRNVPTLRISDR